MLKVYHRRSRHGLYAFFTAIYRGHYTTQSPFPRERQVKVTNSREGPAWAAGERKTDPASAAPNSNLIEASEEKHGSR